MSCGKYSIMGPVRIASLSPAATEILFLLGRGKDIVCTDQFSNFPEETKAIPHLRDHQKVDLAEIKTYNPDLILTATVVQEKLAGMLKVAELPVVHQDPRTMDAVYDSIKSLGIIVEKEKEASELVAKMKKEFDAVRHKAKIMGRKPKVYVEEWPAFAPPAGATAGRHSLAMASGNWVPEVVSAAGGIAFPIKPGELSREVTLAEVQAFDPDLIVISWCGAGRLSDKNLVMKREGWDSLRAVQNNQVRVIDDSLLNRPGPRLVEGAKQLYGWLFEMLHS